MLRMCDNCLDKFKNDGRYYVEHNESSDIYTATSKGEFAIGKFLRNASACDVCHGEEKGVINE